MPKRLSLSAAERARRTRLQKRRSDKKRLAIMIAQDPDFVRRRNLWRRYKITLDEFNALLREQGGRCAICGEDGTKTSVRGWAVDHDHKTGKVRGILCHHCNLALGHTKDDPDIVRGLEQYLQRNSVLSLGND